MIMCAPQTSARFFLGILSIVEANHSPEQKKGGGGNKKRKIHVLVENTTWSFEVLRSTVCGDLTKDQFTNSKYSSHVEMTCMCHALIVQC